MGVCDLFEMVNQNPLQVDMTILGVLMIQYIINNTWVVSETIFKNFLFCCLVKRG